MLTLTKSELRGRINKTKTINYDGLNDHERFVLYVYSANMDDKCARTRVMMKHFQWSRYKIQKLYRELSPLVECVATFNESTGMLSGRGYYFHSALLK